MSGQLASWVSKHYRAGPLEKAVAIQYALVADPHGRPTYILSVADLIERTGSEERAVYKGRRKAKDDKVLRELEHGGGAGNAAGSG